MKVKTVGRVELSPSVDSGVSLGGKGEFGEVWQVGRRSLTSTTLGLLLGGRDGVEPQAQEGDEVAHVQGEGAGVGGGVGVPRQLNQAQHQHPAAQQSQCVTLCNTIQTWTTIESVRSL